MTDNTSEIKPIRILRIIARLNVGGPAIHVALLTEKLTAPTYESILLSGSISAEEGDMVYYAESRGVKPIFIDGLGREINPLRDISTIYQLYKLMRELKPDVVHTHTAKAGFVGRVAAWLARVPVIVHTFHGHVFKGYFSPLVTSVFIQIERMTARMSDTVITLTEGLRGELADEYRIVRRKNITVLPLGLDLEHFSKTPRKQGHFRQQLNIPASAPLIGIVGRLVPVKNHALFLQAAAHIKQKYADARFILVGDGELRPELEAQIEALGLRENVIITGWTRDVAPIYSDLDVLVISSVNEGTPVTVIEGVSAGVPVVATAVGGLPDLLDQGKLGVLVPSNDVGALSNSILEVIENPPEMTQAQALMLDRYGIDRLVKDMDSLYRGLLAKKRR